MCDQQRLRPACAYAQSDQGLCLSLEYYMNIKLLNEHNLEFSSLKEGYTGSSESIHVKMPHCWKLHVAAQFCHSIRSNKDELYILRNLKSCTGSPDKRQSQTLILSTNVDQKSLEIGFSIAICRAIFRLPFVARLATNDNQKHCF